MSDKLLYTHAFNVRREAITEAVNMISNGTDMGRWQVMKIIDMATHFVVVAATRNSYPWFEMEMEREFSPDSELPR